MNQNNKNEKNVRDVSKIMWLWVPLLFFICQILWELFLPANILMVLHAENGLHEILQACVIALAFIVSLRCLYNLRGQKNSFLAAWVGLAAFCCLYVAGEEVSWGQHIFDWTSSEFWNHINDQNETNLHNTTSWLDQKPRLILLLGVVVGGILIPVFQRYKPSFVPKRFEMIYPSCYLAPTAIFVLLITILDKIEEAIDSLSIFERASEVQELYLFYFVLLYMIELYNRISLSLFKPVQ